MTEFLTKEVMWPTASARFFLADSVEAAAAGSIEVSPLYPLAEYQSEKSITSPGGTCELLIGSKTPLSIPAIDAYVQAAPDDRPFVLFALYLGYRGVGSWLVFTGWVTAPEFGERNQTLRISGVDDLPLVKAHFSEMTTNQLPQAVVEKLVAGSGMTLGAVVDLSLATKPVKMEVEADHSARDALANLREHAKIRWGWHIDVRGNFVWRPWSLATAAMETQAATGGGYNVLEYRKNIVALHPVEADLPALDEMPLPDAKDKVTPVENPAEPTGPLYEVETIPHPWLEAGMIVRLAGYTEAAAALAKAAGGPVAPRAKDGYYRIDSIAHRGGAETRSTMTIRGIAA